MQLPAAARAVRQATLEAVDAAQGHDEGEYEDATQRLANQEPEHVRQVLGRVVRQLLEDTHEQGLAADDLLDIIRSCVRNSIGWYSGLDVEALLVVLTGALGIHEPDEEPRRWTPLEVARHAPLFITELLTSPAPHPPLTAYIDSAFADLQRAELNEMP